MPPAYAAIKRDGRALYDYARAGETIEVAPRAVTIFALELVDFGGPEQVALRVHCSKGTYVRALARDLGRVLGTGGHVTALRRTRSGPFALDVARPLDEVLAALAGGGRRPAGRLAGRRAGSPSGGHGRRGACPPVAGGAARRLVGADRNVCAGRVRVLDAAGDLIAVAEPRADGLVHTLRVFGAASQKPAVDLTATVDEGAIL